MCSRRTREYLCGIRVGLATPFSPFCLNKQPARIQPPYHTVLVVALCVGLTCLDLSILFLIRGENPQHLRELSYRLLGSIPLHIRSADFRP